ncbi:MAG: asparaginase [Bacteroidota bacterium]
MKHDRINIITSAPGEPEAAVLIIYTGGTFGMIHDESGALQPFDFSSILEHIPALRQLELKLTVFAFETPIDSSNMIPGIWKKIGKLIFEEYDHFDGFVVLHGTDTMAYSASALSFMLQNLSKPVIFTGAQLPISSLRSDARENLINALEIAAAKVNGRALVPEVCIYFDYKLFRGNRTKKVESVFFDAFNSENYPALAESGVEINYNLSAISPNTDAELILHDKFVDQIAILKIFPGMNKSYVKAILAAPGLKGVILETYGAGNAPTFDWFVNALAASIRSGISVLNISQCPGGRVQQGRYQTSKQLLEIGVIDGKDLTLEAAIAKLMITLAQASDKSEIEHKIKRSWCGELSEK